MHKVVLDSTVLVSAFLAKAGVSAELLHKAKDGGFDRRSKEGQKGRILNIKSRRLD